MRTRPVFALLLALTLQAATSYGRDIYVDNVAGDDSRDGSSASVSQGRGGPCRSIHRALELAAAGDRIVLAKTESPYRESVTLQAGRHSGAPTRPFEIIGSGAVLDGSEPVPPSAWEHVRGRVYRFRPSRKAHHGLFLDGKPAKRQAASRDGGLPDLQPLEWALYRGHVYFRPEKGRLPIDYDISHTVLPVGITLYEVRHVVIRDLAVQGFQLDGVSAHDSVFDATLVGLICRGNGRSGISVGGASRVRIVASLVGDNGEAQVRTEGHSRTQIINCDLLDKSAPPLVREGGEVAISSPAAETP